MALMIPTVMSPDIKSNAEKHIFEWFKNAPDTDDWIVLHSMGISSHRRVIHGETDFLVLAPGKGIFALEVKGGRVKRELGKWIFINKYGDIDQKVRGPFDQAWEGIYSIKSSIEIKLDSEHRHLKQVMFGIGVMFPDIDYQSVGVDEESWQVFDINDGKNVRDFIQRITDGALRTRKRLEYAVSEDAFPTSEDIKYIASLLRGDFDQDVPLRIKQKYTEEHLLSLTNEQAQCIEQLEDNPRCLIRGTAGTGKTLLAIEASKKAALSGEYVALFCYNKALGEWLEDYFAGLPRELRPMYVGTFHGYMMRLLKSRGISISVPVSNEFYECMLPKMAENSLRDNPLPFTRVIIDEAQDLIEDNYLQVLNLCLSGGLSNGKWTMFGDFSMQSIYSDSMTELAYLEVLESWSSFTLFKLRKNCRNTKKICIDIENIVGISENAAFEDHINTPSVDHIIYSDMNDQKTRLVLLLNDLISKNIKRENIVILSPKKRSNSVVNLLDGIIVKNYSVKEAGNITFSTIQGYKGLESSTVILTDIESYENEKLIYVGLSRARFDLHIFETKEASDERVQLFFERRFANE